MSALYFSISRDQACSLPDRHSLTRRVSVHAAACFFGAVSITGRRSLLHYAGKAGRHSRAHTVPARRDGSYQLYSLLPPECQGWREKSSVDFPPESPAHGHRVSSVVRCTVPARRDGSYQLYSLLPPECQGWREKSSVDFPPESPAHGHRVSSVVRCLSPSVARP